MSKGIFIVFEGGEGSGKTYHSEVLAERLQSQGHAVVRTHEPGGTKIGKSIREIILHENASSLAHRAELFLFFADRAQHMHEVIQPALNEGKIVICDRFSGSTFAYQIGGRNLSDESFIVAMDAYAREHLSPDVVLYLDIDPQKALERKTAAKQILNRLDKEELAFHERVHAYFNDLTQKEPNWIQIASEGDAKENANRIWESVQPYFSSLT